MQIIRKPDTKIELGYWAIRGLAQPIRFLLSVAEAGFTEIRLGADQNGNLLSREDENIDWDNHRTTLDMPFRNLPYLIDSSGDETVKLTQSNVIMRYLARRFDFYGDNESESLMIDILQEEAYDFRNKIVRTAYTLGNDYEAALSVFIETALPRYLDGFENYLDQRENKSCFIGTRISLVDFNIYELAWQMTHMVPGSVSVSIRPNLFAFIKTFEQQPQITKYLASEHYIERPINSPWASFS